MYNDHKKVHAIKFQSAVAPNGLTANVFDPVEGRKHVSGTLGDSGLLRRLQQHAHGPNGNILCIYGDPAYPLKQQLMGPFSSLLYLMRAIARTQASTPATSLMRVKNSKPHFCL